MNAGILCSARWPSPLHRATKSAWLIMRGCDTLSARREMVQRSVLYIAQQLETHAAVKRVVHPGLPRTRRANKH